MPISSTKQWAGLVSLNIPSLPAAFSLSLSQKLPTKVLNSFIDVLVLTVLLESSSQKNILASHIHLPSKCDNKEHDEKRLNRDIFLFSLSFQTYKISLLTKITKFYIYYTDLITIVFPTPKSSCQNGLFFVKTLKSSALNS